ncbi:MAG TPA: restriction endonuclease subunit S [bacterium]|nr:restriction endonuclease subunit S [bacterium]
MSKNNENKLVPKLRFPEFMDFGAWEIDEVGNVFDVTRGYVLAMNLVTEEQSENNPFPVYSSQTKNKGLAGYYKDYLYEDAITWTTDGANAGDVNFRKGKFYCTNVCGVLINKKGYSNHCVAALINSVSRKHVSYVGNPKLMNGVMSKIRIPFPKIPEQQKIAACLSSLDEVITAESQKLDVLQDYKRGLLQNLLPQNGETSPQLRFKEFEQNGDWKETTLTQVADYENGKAHEQDIVDDGDYIVVNSKFISSDGDVKKFTNIAFCPAQKGDILMVLSDVPNGKAIAKCFWVEEDNRYTVNQRICKITPHNLDSKILYYLLNRNPYFLAFDDGVKQTNLRKEDVLNCPLLIPSDPKEQEKIATCLSSLDEIISAQSQKIETLKLHKKGLLQGLFPGVNET